eukprot:scaffold172464_cov36-Cyclotella_meneghiniana.AAC.2
MEQREEYLKENPSHASFFGADKGDKGDGDNSDDDVLLAVFVQVNESKWPINYFKEQSYFYF